MVNSAQIQKVRKKLGELKAYKKLLETEGLEPDWSDKERESELIKQLIRLEKNLPPKPMPQKRRKKST